MKVFIAIIALTLTVASQASYVPEAAYPSWPVSTSVWPPYGVYGKGLYNAWPHANVAAWNGHSYVNSWSPEWAPSYGYDNGLYGHKVNSLNSAYSWGLPWETYGNAAGVYGWGHKGGYLSSVPVSKQIAATPGSFHVAPVPVGGEKLIVA
ncbi:AAEL002180-PA [Aedes aegypti]|uniref:AAEL002180-PA n=1 Tax=Aedes aegypti TaxID=7159 RepID=Q17IZ0_AEDAE|nr:AAEL002180-PA [Aedes aegypti]